MLSDVWSETAGWSEDGKAFRIRALRTEDVARSSEIHHQALAMEFLARCGIRFLRRYHRAWTESGEGIALAAVDDHGRLVGVLLGSFSPARHYRRMVRRHGLALAFLLALHALGHPRFARELVATRTVRYVRGLLRMLATSLVGRSSRGGPPAGVADTTVGPLDPLPRIGEIVHVMVSVEAAGNGVGRGMLGAARRLAEAAGLGELVLVTLPDLPAVGFYEHLGWERVGVRTNRSGERFVHFRLALPPVGEPGSTPATGGEPQGLC